MPFEIFTSVVQADGYEESVLIGVRMPGAALHLTTATLRAENGDTIMQRADVESGNRGRFYFTGQLPLQQLTPGNYVLNLEAYTRDGVPASASQELQFEVE